MVYKQFYAALFSPLEATIGPIDENTIFAIIGFDCGGSARVSDCVFLRAFRHNEPGGSVTCVAAGPLFERREGDDPFERNPGRPLTPEMPQLKTCIQCHQAPGVYSILSMERCLRNPLRTGEVFRTYAWDVETNYTVKAKVERFDWGLLQGKLEAK